MKIHFTTHKHCTTDYIILTLENAQMEQFLYSTQYTTMFGTVLQCFKRWFLWIWFGNDWLLSFEVTEIMRKSPPYLYSD